ncbi:MAG: CBS domain-containing protein [Xanthomonadales bacterium]|nr:CBS domain-containing protein [Xanthomonadales bacterium]MCB1634049.1 CBS domain-containing protein [Xanthomonadales bacterium]
MQTVGQLLERKGNDIYSVSPDNTMFQAITEMAERGVGALLVMEGERMVGVISERDYARKVVLKGRASKETPVRDVMTATVISTDEQATVDRCMRLMTDHRIRHLPVLRGDQVVGMLSIGDLVKAIISDQQFQIEQLSNYIAG